METEVVDDVRPSPRQVSAEHDLDPGGRWHVDPAPLCPVKPCNYNSNLKAECRRAARTQEAPDVP
jgi:hypothetical protein